MKRATTRKEFMTVFNSFSLEDKLLIVKHIQTQMANAEELADIAAYKRAKQKSGKSIPFDEASEQVQAYHDKQAK